MPVDNRDLQEQITLCRRLEVGELKGWEEQCSDSAGEEDESGLGGGGISGSCGTCQIFTCFLVLIHIPGSI